MFFSQKNRQKEQIIGRFEKNTIFLQILEKTTNFEKKYSLFFPVQALVDTASSRVYKLHCYKHEEDGDGNMECHRHRGFRTTGAGKV